MWTAPVRLVSLLKAVPPTRETWQVVKTGPRTISRHQTRHHTRAVGVIMLAPAQVASHFRHAITQLDFLLIFAAIYFRPICSDRQSAWLLFPGLSCHDAVRSRKERCIKVLVQLACIVMFCYIRTETAGLSACCFYFLVSK